LFLGRLAQAASSGNWQCAERSGSPGSLTPLPISARSFLERLPSFDSLTTALAALKPFLLRPATVTPGRRLALLMGWLVPIFTYMFLASVGMSYAIHYTRTQRSSVEASPLIACLNYLQTNNPVRVQDHEAMQIYVAKQFAAAITNESFWSTNRAALHSSLTPELRRLGIEAVARHPVVTEEEFQQAEARLTPFLDESVPSSENLPGTEAMGGARRGSEAMTPRTLLATILAGTGPITLIFVIVPSLFCALVLRRGPRFYFLNVEIVTAGGTVASRWRTFLRALVAWAPLLACILIGLKSAMDIIRNEPPGVWPGVVLAIAGAVAVFGTAYAIRHPERAFQERASGTWLVPK
jgi:hypothetical protein